MFVLKKLYNDSRLVLRVAPLAHVLPPVSSSKKHSGLIGLTLAGSGPRHGLGKLGDSTEF